MHFCTAFIAVAGDDQQIMYRDPFNPVSWPEIEVLRQIHGDLAVREVKPFVRIEQDPRAEKERLSLIYGEIVGKQVWVGRGMMGELDAAELADGLPASLVWRNPITNEILTIGIEPEKVDGRSKAARQTRLSEAAKARPRDEKGRLLPAAAEDDRGSIEEVI